jgi:hypothetical protein
MKCEDALEVLRWSDAAATAERRAAEFHLAQCASCRLAERALAVLDAERRVPVPRLAEGAFERALQRAVVQQRPVMVAPSRRGFWLGTAVGGALAASIAVAITFLWLQPDVPFPTVNPEVTLALNEVREVSVALESPEALAGAEIHVVLTGAIGLQGFAEQRELRWVTNLDRGVNQLTLPLVARGPSGGQVMVEVQHGDKRRTFVLDVQTEPKRDSTV